MIGKLTEVNIPLAPKFCLFHIYPVNLEVNASKRKLIEFSLLQAKYRFKIEGNPMT